MTDKNKTGLNGQGSDQQILEQRITVLGKEVADLKRQLESRLTHRQVVETIAHFLHASANSVFIPEYRGNKDVSHKIIT